MRFGVPFQLAGGGPGGWWIIDDLELHVIPDTVVLVPDLAGWRRERVPQIAQGHRFTVAPDWVCEILSPASASLDRDVKLPIYARYGVSFAWLFDPKARTLEAYALEEGR
jgi:Uma2 family endonuclease